MKPILATEISAASEQLAAFYHGEPHSAWVTTGVLHKPDGSAAQYSEIDLSLAFVPLLAAGWQDVEVRLRRFPSATFIRVAITDDAGSAYPGGSHTFRWDNDAFTDDIAGHLFGIADWIRDQLPN